MRVDYAELGVSGMAADTKFVVLSGVSFS